LHDTIGWSRHDHGVTEIVEIAKPNPVAISKNLLVKSGRIRFRAYEINWQAGSAKVGAPAIRVWLDLYS